MHKNALHADTWHRRVRKHTRCTGNALQMHKECAQNARRTAPLLRRVIAPPRLGVVFIAVLLEDHEQVVDVVLLLVLRAPSVGLLVRLQVELRVVRVCR